MPSNEIDQVHGVICLQLAGQSITLYISIDIGNNEKINGTKSVCGEQEGGRGSDEKCLHVFELISGIIREIFA